MDKGILKNVSINFIGLILPTFVSLVTVPAYIHALGVERYGVVSLVWTLIGYFGILDLGMSMAAQNHISKALASGDADESARVFWSAFWLNLGTGIAGGLLIYFGAFVYTAYFTKVSAAMQHEVYLALPWLALAIPLANVSWVFAGAINGAERFGVFNTNQTIGTFLFQLLPLAAAWWIAPNLQTVLAAAVVARLIAAVMLGQASIKVLGIRRIDPPQWGTAKGLFNFGGWMLIASTTSMIADTLDRVMLGAGMGAKFVTYYTVPQNLVTRLNMLPNALVRTLFPRLSAVGRDHADTLARQSLEFLNGVFTPVGIVAIFALAPFLTLWVGADLAAHSAPVGRVLVISVWLVGQASVTRILIQSQVNPARAAFAGLVEMPFFVGGLWFGIHHFGLIGAAVVVAARARRLRRAAVPVGDPDARNRARHARASRVPAGEPVPGAGVAGARRVDRRADAVDRQRTRASRRRAARLGAACLSRHDQLRLLPVPQPDSGALRRAARVLRARADAGHRPRRGTGTAAIRARRAARSPVLALSRKALARLQEADRRAAGPALRRAAERVAALSVAWTRRAAEAGRECVDTGDARRPAACRPTPRHRATPTRVTCMPRNPSTDPVTRRMLRHRFHARRPASPACVARRAPAPRTPARHRVPTSRTLRSRPRKQKSPGARAAGANGTTTT